MLLRLIFFFFLCIILSLWGVLSLGFVNRIRRVELASRILLFNRWELNSFMRLDGFIRVIWSCMIFNFLCHWWLRIEMVRVIGRWMLYSNSKTRTFNIIFMDGALLFFFINLGVIIVWSLEIWWYLWNRILIGGFFRG